MENISALTLTVEEGNNILSIASGFALPEKLSDHQKYSNSERVLANMEAALLYKVLREHSPLLKSKKRLLFFGPEEAYEEIKDPMGRTGRRVIDPDCAVRLELGEAERRGLEWCLLARLHPNSDALSPAGDQIMLVWPVARKIGCEEYLREQIGLDKAEPKVHKNDRDYKKNGKESTGPMDLETERARA